MEKQMYVCLHARGYHYVELMTAEQAAINSNVVEQFSALWFDPKSRDVHGYVEEN